MSNYNKANKANNPSNIPYGITFDPNAPYYASVTAGGAGASGSTWSSSYTLSNQVTPNITLNNDGTVEAKDVVIDGVSLKDTLQVMQDRLAILQPKPELLEKYVALKDLYDQYKTMEALLNESAKKSSL